MSTSAPILGGIENQVWKDSVTAYTHTNGEIVNYDSGVAALEVQGYAYDALKGIRNLFPGSVREGMVENLGRRIIEYFWLEEEQMFAQAIDRDGYGRFRHVRTPSSNSGLILDSDVLLDLPEYRHMVEATVSMMMGPDFLTPAGIRCRSLEFYDIVDFPDYHGCFAVWFKETSDIINGFLAHGYEDEARLLAQNLVTTVETLGEYYEFCFVDEDGQIIPPDNQTGRFADKRCSKPERGQAWTISAFLRCLRLLDRNAAPAPAAA